MAGNSDGSVIIDTSLDLDGIEKAAKEFLKAVDDMVSKGNKIFNGFVVHVDGIEEAEKDLDILNQRIKDLADDRMDIAKTFEEASQAFGEDSEQANGIMPAVLSDTCTKFAANQREYECISLRHAAVQFSNADAHCANRCL